MASKNDIIFKLGMDTKEAASELKSFSSNAKKSVDELTTLLSTLKSTPIGGKQKDIKRAFASLDTNIKNIEASSKAIEALAGKAESLSKTKGGKKLGDDIFKSIIEAQSKLMAEAKSFIDSFDKLAASSPMSQSLRIDNRQNLKSAGNLFSLKFEEKLDTLAKVLNDIQNKAVRDIVAKTRAFEGGDVSGMGKAVADYASTSAVLSNQEQLSKYYQSMHYRAGYLQTDYWKGIQGASRARFRGLSKGGYVMDETDVQIHHPFYEGLKGLEWKPENLQKLEGLTGFEHIQETAKQLQSGILNWTKQQADDLIAEANAQIEPEGTKVSSKVRALHKQYQKNFDLLIRRAVDFYTELNKIIETGGDPSAEAIKTLKSKASAYERVFAKTNVKGQALDVEVFKKQIGESQLDYIKGVTDMSLANLKVANLKKMAETKSEKTSAGYYLDDRGKAKLDENASLLKQFSSSIEKGATDPRRFMESLRLVMQKRAEWIQQGVSSNDEMLKAYSRVIESVKPSRRISELRARATSSEKQIATEAFASASRDITTLDDRVKKLSVSTKGTAPVIRELSNWPLFVEKVNGFSKELGKVYGKLRSAFKTGDLLEMTKAVDQIVELRVEAISASKSLKATKRKYSGEKLAIGGVQGTVDVDQIRKDQMVSIRDRMKIRDSVLKEAETAKYGAMPGLAKSDIDYSTITTEELKNTIYKSRDSIRALRGDIYKNLRELKQYNRVFEDAKTASLFKDDPYNIRESVSHLLKEGTSDKSKTRTVAENVITQAKYYTTDLNKDVNITKERSQKLGDLEYRLKQELARISSRTEQARRLYTQGKTPSDIPTEERKNWGENERLEAYTNKMKDAVKWRSTLNSVVKDFDVYAKSKGLTAVEKPVLQRKMMMDLIALREKLGQPLTKGMLDFNIKEDEKKITKAVRLIDRIDERLDKLRSKKQSPIRDALITGLERKKEALSSSIADETPKTAMDKLASRIGEMQKAYAQYRELLNPTKFASFAEGKGITDAEGKAVLARGIQQEISLIDQKLGRRKSEQTVMNEILEAENKVINKLTAEKQLTERIAQLKREVAAAPSNKEKQALLAYNEKSLKDIRGLKESKIEAPIGQRIADEMEKTKGKVLEAKEAVRLIQAEKERLRTSTKHSKEEIKSMTKALDEMERGYTNVSQGIGKNVGAFKKLGDGIGGVVKTMVEMAKWQSIWYLSKGTVFALPQLVGMGTEYAKEIDSMNFKLLRWKATSGEVTASARADVKAVADEIRKTLLTIPGDFKETLGSLEDLIGAGMEPAVAKELTGLMTIMKSSFPEIDFSKFAVAAMGAFNVFKDSIEGATDDAGKFKILMEQLMRAQAESIARPEHFAKIMQYMSEMGKIAGMTTEEVFALSTTIADTGVTTSQSSRLLSGFITQLGRSNTLHGINRLFSANNLSEDNLLNPNNTLSKNLTKTMEGLRKIGFSEKAQPTEVFAFLTSHGMIPKEEIKVFGALVDRWEEYLERVQSIEGAKGASYTLAEELKKTIDGQIKMIKHALNELGSAGNLSSRGLGLLVNEGLNVVRGALLAVNPELAKTAYSLDSLSSSGKTAHSAVSVLVTTVKTLAVALSPILSLLKMLVDALAAYPTLTSSITFGAMILGISKLVNFMSVAKLGARFFGIELASLGAKATTTAFNIKMTEVAVDNLAKKTLFKSFADGSLVASSGAHRATAEAAKTSLANKTATILPLVEKPFKDKVLSNSNVLGMGQGLGSTVGLVTMVAGSQMKDENLGEFTSKLGLLTVVGSQLLAVVPSMAVAITKLVNILKSLPWKNIETMVKWLTKLSAMGPAISVFGTTVSAGLAAVTTGIYALGGAVGFFLGKWGYNAINYILGESEEQVNDRIKAVVDNLKKTPALIADIDTAVRKAEEELGTSGFVNADTLKELERLGIREFGGSADKLQKLREKLSEMGIGTRVAYSSDDDKGKKDINVPDEEELRKRATDLANLEKEIRNLQLTAIKAHLDAMKNLYKNFYDWGWLSADKFYEMELKNIERHYNAELEVVKAGEALIREERERARASEVGQILSPKSGDDKTPRSKREFMKPEEVLALVRKVSAEERSKISPELMTNLLKIESSFDPQVVNKYGTAFGLGQLKSGTALEMGIHPSKLFNAEDNIRAAIRYMNKQYSSFGNIEDALGAYNAGPTGFRNIKKKGAGWKDMRPDVAGYIASIMNPSDTKTIEEYKLKELEQAEKAQTQLIQNEIKNRTTIEVDSTKRAGDAVVSISGEKLQQILDTNKKYELRTVKDRLDIENQTIKIVSDRLSKEINLIAEHHKRKIALVDELNARKDSQDAHEYSMAKMNFDKKKQLALAEATYLVAMGKMREADMFDFRGTQIRQDASVERADAERARKSFYATNATKLASIDKAPSYIKDIEKLIEQADDLKLTNPEASKAKVAEIQKVIAALTDEQKALLSELDLMKIVSERIKTENTYREAVTASTNKETVALKQLNNEMLLSAEYMYKVRNVQGVWELTLGQMVAQYGKTGQQLQDLTKTSFGAMQSTMSTVFSDFFKGELDSAEKYFLSFLNKLGDALSEFMSNQFMNMFTRLLGGKGSPGGGDFLSSLFGTFFNGGGSASSAYTAGTSGFGTAGLLGPMFVGHSGGYILHSGGFIPRFHSGGLNSDEVPAILQKGEYVVSRRGVAALDKINSGSVGGSPKVSLVVNNNTGQSVKPRHSVSQGANPQELIVTLWLDAFNRDSYGLRKTLGG